ncbi:PQQ-binding-like beta-propeller repeat protein [Kitasatospora sp. GP82]|uniref:outer membrane protein assembly factor BamB family protein n=1 Tax=Kitasatospora sp. GP82 TaxID=3035089 RepID=UPI0024768BEE|nr:PQQ-binding-like beta-propeller repeat protein [Kitasatospora sp. GP82]MDH6130140.1 outer membrane protein assembly factor BamB [Kitasatospora sp. GP82]
MSVIGLPNTRGQVRRRRLTPGWLGLTALAVFSLAIGPGIADPRPSVASAAEAPDLRTHPRDWAVSNGDLANTRATTRTPINSHNVKNLKVKWRLPLDGKPTFAGIMASNPIVVGDTVYLINLDSDVYAVDKESGKVRWKHEFNSPTVGPNGVAYAHGLLYGTTFTGAFALDPETGRTVWSRELLTADQGGIDVAPQVYDDTVVVSTVPSTFGRYVPGSMGIIWALDAATGTPKWNFNTVKDGDLWGHPEINSGGGSWFAPALDGHGRIFLSVANPGPLPGTPEYPNGSSRPGPNLYTNCLVALDSRTGKLLWYQQTVPHDLRDYDLQDPAIITTARIGGVSTEVVVVAGKMGKVYAYRADDGTPLWTLPVGTHLNDEGPLPNDPVTVLPGIIGGVETPMALADGRVFVPWVDNPGKLSATGGLELPDNAKGRGGLTAADVATGKVLWQRDLPQMALGAATVANDVVFTATFDGQIFGVSTATGDLLWTSTARAGIIAFPAVSGDLLLVGAGAPGLSASPVPELIAYSL